MDNPLAAGRAYARRQAHEYAQGEERPLGGYLALLGTFGAGLAGVVAVARATGRPAPHSLGAKDLFLLTVAAHKLSRLLAKEPVSSPFRAPFTRFRGSAAPAEVSEEVRGHGVRHAAGELATCPFCLTPWAVTALLAVHTFSPATARTACSGLTAVAGSDFLQYAYAALQRIEND